MTKIDLKDRKILYELDLNCRQSNTQIGKKVGLKRDVVAYRINRMREEGIIKNFWTVIDTFKLGYNVFRVYLNFQDISHDEKKDLIQDFVDYRNSWAVYSITGPIDLGVVVWVKNVYEFYNFLDKILDKFGKYISKKNLSIYVQADEYEKSYLLLDKNNKNEREKFSITCIGEKVDVDELDYKLLDIITLDARMPLIDVAEKLGTSSQTVNYRLQNLMKTEVIKGFRINIDVSKLDLQYFDVRINLTDHSYRKKIIVFLENTSYLKCINTAFGYADLELELILENMDKLIQTMDELDVKFPRVIRNYHLLKTKNTYKERWLPELV
jgi:DNA-binding Lrp family transcriptional regulator